MQCANHHKYQIHFMSVFVRLYNLSLLKVHEEAHDV